MAINRSLGKSYYASATSNGSQVIKNITRRFQQLDQYGERLVEEIAKVFVEEAQKRLWASGYDVGDLLNNIYCQPYGKNKWRVGIKNNDEKPIMYFLEFGTGLVGADNPHPSASELGWQYIVHPENIVPTNGQNYDSYVRPSGFNSLGEYVGMEGWYYYDENNELRFTSGLKAVAYIYDTIKDLDTVKKIALERVRRNG